MLNANATRSGFVNSPAQLLVHLFRLDGQLKQVLVVALFAFQFQVLFVFLEFVPVLFLERIRCRAQIGSRLASEFVLGTGGASGVRSGFATAVAGLDAGFRLEFARRRGFLEHSRGRRCR